MDSVAGGHPLLLLYSVNPWVEPPAGIVRQVVTVAFWVFAITQIEGPAFARHLFGNSRAGILWLSIRLFIGFSWLESGLGKMTNPEWTNGAALRP